MPELPMTAGCANQHLPASFEKPEDLPDLHDSAGYLGQYSMTQKRRPSDSRPRSRASRPSCAPWATRV